MRSMLYWKGQVKYIDHKWNFLYDRIHDLKKDQNQMRDLFAKYYARLP